MATNYNVKLAFRRNHFKVPPDGRRHALQVQLFVINQANLHPLPCLRAVRTLKNLLCDLFRQVLVTHAPSSIKIAGYGIGLECKSPQGVNLAGFDIFGRA
ncbi:hypothetical protein [Acidovorax sp. CCYZU-2555]|uniref:hypothetical protein n=1 Tax=Acidovorax sp. CCYZU-2555 TaxID=2835042 RepID=UPI001BCE9A98|nr:hypothetical protein [Acidovorax sp. CCYZU-2555]MBS7777683.1 hypothetical protein [Acidovorax sp. CCYZU-2555]